MKSFIVTIATLILMVNIWVVTNGLMSLNRHNEELRFIASQASVAGALYVDDMELKYRLVKFDDVQSVAAAKDIVCRNMRLNTGQLPLENSYWKNAASITVYIYDDVSCRVYVDDSLVQEFEFDYPILHTDPESGFAQAVVRPCVCVTIDAGVRPIGGGFMRLYPEVRKSAAYELVGR